MTKLESTKQSGLVKTSSADSFQIRSVSQDRFVKKLGVLTDKEMDAIRVGLTKVLSIDSVK